MRRVPFEVVGLLADSRRFRIRVTHARDATDAVLTASRTLRYAGHEGAHIVAAMTPPREMHVVGDTVDLTPPARGWTMTARNDPSASVVKVVSNRIVREGMHRWRRVEVVVYDPERDGRGDPSSRRLYVLDVDAGTGTIRDGLPNDSLESEQVRADIISAVRAAMR